MAFWKRDKAAPPAPVREPEPAVEKTAVELLEESVRLLKQGLAIESEERMRPVNESLQANEAKLTAARETADKLGIRKALAYSIQELQHHHSWIHIEEKYRDPAPGIHINEGAHQTIEGTDHTGLALTIECRPYVLKWTRRNFQGDIYGTASFETEAPEILFAIEYNTTYRHDFEQVHAGAVTKLTLGEWVHDLVRLAERLRTSHDLILQGFNADLAAKRAQDI